MFGFIIDTMCTMFGGRIGNKCIPFLADMFFNSFEVYTYKGVLEKNEKKLYPSVNFINLDDFISKDNSKLCNFVDCVYPTEFEIKYATYTARSVSYFEERNFTTKKRCLDL